MVLRSRFYVNKNRKKMYPGEDIIDLGEFHNLKPEHVYDKLDCQGEQENLDDLLNGCIDDPEFESFGYLGNLDQRGEEYAVGVEDFKYKKISLPSSSELNQMSRCLVPEQMNALRKVVSACKEIVKAKHNTSVKPKPLRMIIHGGAGNRYSST